MTRRIGIIGLGFIGRYVYEQIVSRPELGLEPAFVHNRTPERLADIPAEHVLEDLGDFASREADLIVELAHPAITQQYGAAILGQTDYMIMSVTALADASVERELMAVCQENGTRLLIAHGALVGVDNLHEGRDNWRDVTITFHKHPGSIDFSESGFDPETVSGETVLHDGPVRELALKYPRNVNTMVTCALATVGLDRCRGVFVTDPAYDFALAEVVAVAHDESRIETFKREPSVGVSGKSLLESQIASIQKTGAGIPGLTFV